MYQNEVSIAETANAVRTIN